VKREMTESAGGLWRCGGIKIREMTDVNVSPTKCCRVDVFLELASPWIPPQKANGMQILDHSRK